MTKIQIIYIVTGGYCNYFTPFIKSLKNFSKRGKLYVTVYSDSLEEYNGFSNEDVENVEVIRISNLIYPTININKPVLINDAIHRDSDYVFIIDADSLIIDNPMYYWDSLLKDMDENKILVTKHPFYIMSEEATMWGMTKSELISNLYTENLTEKDDRFAAYIEDSEYTYINSAFWAANRETMKRFNNKIIEMTKKDMTRYPNGYHVPKYMDENYVNKLVNNYEHGDTTFDFAIKSYTALYNIKSDMPNTVFMYQKNMKDYKFDRR